MDRYEVFVRAVTAGAIVRDLRNGRDLAVAVVVEAEKDARSVPKDGELADHVRHYLAYQYSTPSTPVKRPAWVFPGEPVAANEKQSQ